MIVNDPRSWWCGCRGAAPFTVSLRIGVRRHRVASCASHVDDAVAILIAALDEERRRVLSSTGASAMLTLFPTHQVGG
jgi:hypothetical protein